MCAIITLVLSNQSDVVADHHAQEGPRQLQKAGILQMVAPADVLRKYDGPIRGTIRRDLCNQKLLNLCQARFACSTGATARRARRNIAGLRVENSMNAGTAHVP
jgi:hypothetical protein